MEEIAEGPDKENLHHAVIAVDQIRNDRPPTLTR
jgi:hypothetical protein